MVWEVAAAMEDVLWEDLVVLEVGLEVVAVLEGVQRHG
jgi:hypothetical protein